MKTVSIGFYKDNGDFAIVATLNNNEGRMSDQEFEAEVERVSSIFAKHLGMWHTFVLQRQDAPDYITLEESTNA
jgi:hypothetical protein